MSYAGGAAMRLLDFARMVRLPNAFTAMSDICLGGLATGALGEHFVPFVCLLLSSTCLYSAGMVWNDYFDIDQDKRERPFRPLASGRVPIGEAFRLGMALFGVGLLFAAVADWQNGEAGWKSLTCAIILTAAILLYDGWLKRTWMGPIMMGTCRFMNVLLGLSVSAQAPAGWGVALALVVGVYIAGVTWFARTEAHVSNQHMLIAGAALMLTGILLALTVPPLAQAAGAAPTTAFLFPYLLAAFACYVGSAVVRAVRYPLPKHVQKAVKRAVLGLVVLDAILATALAGLAGLVLLFLMIPAQILGRWVYST
jgi:4-hydroxybenzoate polyprenyltransferase